MSNAAPTTNPNDVTIRRIFNHLDRRAPSEARNIRSAFDDLWDNLYYLSEYLEDAAHRFDREERDLLMAEYNRVQSAIAVMGQSSLPVIMPDGSEDETPAQPATVATPATTPATVEPQRQRTAATTPAARTTVATSRAITTPATNTNGQPSERPPQYKSLGETVFATLHILGQLTSDVGDLEDIEPGDLETEAICKLAADELHHAIWKAAKQFDRHLR
ncbi:hypothetical protein SV7mr_31460 [Stieleria bergensis]|uniref:Uncharacterized protein n=1 Tax=Stieleria bergensis TaxID=2528025 RepID=A0A517SWW2_9BACT|nr:hypothetical protein SV7mr_31460 [Planctomycetes bacterium SV_7m_r]